jgi:hypothetical protein
VLISQSEVYFSYRDECFNVSAKTHALREMFNNTNKFFMCNNFITYGCLSIIIIVMKGGRDVRNYEIPEEVVSYYRTTTVVCNM